jgi:hypothetical protein
LCDTVSPHLRGDTVEVTSGFSIIPPMGVVISIAMASGSSYIKATTTRVEIARKRKINQ